MIVNLVWKTKRRWTVNLLSKPSVTNRITGSTLMSDYSFLARGQWDQSGSHCTTFFHGKTQFYLHSVFLFWLLMRITATTANLQPSAGGRYMYHVTSMHVHVSSCVPAIRTQDTKYMRQLSKTPHVALVSNLIHVKNTFC